MHNRGCNFLYLTEVEAMRNRGHNFLGSTEVAAICNKGHNLLCAIHDRSNTCDIKVTMLPQGLHLLDSGHIFM
eukprot:15354307-Ditylum_brightwellii.AAC.1